MRKTPLARGAKEAPRRDGKRPKGAVGQWDEGQPPEFMVGRRGARRHVREAVLQEQQRLLGGRGTRSADDRVIERERMCVWLWMSSIRAHLYLGI